MAAGLRRPARPGRLAVGGGRVRAGAVVTASTRPLPPPGPSPRLRAGVGIAVARRALCRLILVGTGGLRVVGEPPPPPCVLVANHASHTDTVALLAALPARRRPVVAAAADYWYDRPLRRFACRALASTIPVRRTGGGRADLTRAAELLAAGRDVIVYPEGSRSRDGSIAPFHSGAGHLA